MDRVQSKILRVHLRVLGVFSSVRQKSGTRAGYPLAVCPASCGSTPPPLRHGISHTCRSATTRATASKLLRTRPPGEAVGRWRWRRLPHPAPEKTKASSVASGLRRGTSLRIRLPPGLASALRPSPARGAWTTPALREASPSSASREDCYSGHRLRILPK